MNKEICNECGYSKNAHIQTDTAIYQVTCKKFEAEEVKPTDFKLSKLGIDGKELGILYHQGSIKEFIKRLKDGKEAIKEKNHYKANNLDYKVGMIHGYEEALKDIDKLSGGLGE